MKSLNWDYIAAALAYLVAVISLFSGNRTMGLVWFCIGTTWIGVAASRKKK